MDLSIPIIGLMAFVGYKLNDEKTSRKKINKRNKISPHEQPSSQNIYSSSFSKEIQTKEREIANSNFEKSKDPLNTNIIPPLYNTYCKYNCQNTDLSPLKSDKTILPQVENFTPDLKNKKNKQVINGPMFNNKFNGNTSEGIKSNKTKNFDRNAIENFNNLSDLSGLPMQMTHNNMVPFFGSHITQNTQINKNESILDKYTGNSYAYKPKKEIEPMFEKQRENIHGSKPLTTQIDHDRYVQSNLKTNLSPVSQIRVQPFSPAYLRPSYKNVDELRIKTNPKVEYNQRTVKGKHFITNRGISGKVNKNRPDTYYVNSSDRYFTTVADVKAPTSRQQIILRDTPKANTSETPLNVTPAYNSNRSSGTVQYIKQENLKENINSLFTVADDDHRHTYETDWVRNPKYEINSHNYLDRDGYVAYEQERETTNRMTLLPASDVNRGIYANDPNPAKTTNKEANLFSYTGNAVSEVEKHQDYTGAYNNTKQRQYINNPDYKGTPAMTTKGIVDTTQYENIQMFSNREDIADNRGYMSGPQKENIPLGPNGVNIQQKDESVFKQNYDYRPNLNRINVEPTSLFNLGEVSQIDNSNKIVNEHDFDNRINPTLLNAFNKNPYTQSLFNY